MLRTNIRYKFIWQNCRGK